MMIHIDCLDAAVTLEDILDIIHADCSRCIITVNGAPVDHVVYSEDFLDFQISKQEHEPKAPHVSDETKKILDDFDAIIAESANVRITSEATA